VGATVWEALQNGAPFEDAVSAVVARFEVDQVTARADVESLIEELMAAGLVERAV
jgi:hypothetical protein